MRPKRLQLSIEMDCTRPWYSGSLIDMVSELLSD
jgi:hypothetical protein